MQRAICRLQKCNLQQLQSVLQHFSICRAITEMAFFIGKSTPHFPPPRICSDSKSACPTNRRRQKKFVKNKKNF